MPPPCSPVYLIVCGISPCHPESLYAGQPLWNGQSTDCKNCSYTFVCETSIYSWKHCGVFPHPCVLWDFGRDDGTVYGECVWISGNVYESDCHEAAWKYVNKVPFREWASLRKCRKYCISLLALLFTLWKKGNLKMEIKGSKQLYHKLFFIYTAILVCVISALVIFFINSTRKRFLEQSLRYTEMMSESAHR